MESKCKSPNMRVYVRLRLTPSFCTTDCITAFMSQEDRMFLFCYSILSGHLSFFFSWDGVWGADERGVKVYTTGCLTALLVPHKSGHVMQVSLLQREAPSLPAIFLFFFFLFFPSAFFPLTFCCRSFIPFERVKQGKALSSGKRRNQTVFWQCSTVFLFLLSLWSPCSQLCGTAVLVHLYCGSYSFQLRGPRLCATTALLCCVDFSFPLFFVKQMKSQNPDRQANPPPFTNDFVLSLNLAFAVNANSWLAVRASRLWVGALWGSFSHEGRRADRQVNGKQTHWHEDRSKVMMCETCGQLTVRFDFTVMATYKLYINVFVMTHESLNNCSFMTKSAKLYLSQWGICAHSYCAP